MKSKLLTDYGWRVVIAGALAHAVSTGLGHFGLSTYFPSLERELAGAVRPFPVPSRLPV